MSGDTPPPHVSPITASEARRVSFLLTAVVATGALSIDMFLPSLPSMADDFHTSAATAQLTVTLFLAGLACAQLVLGPLSDRFGRRPVLIIGMTLYGMAGWVCWLAPNIHTLIIARVLQAFGAGSGAVLSRAIVRDMFGPQRSARILAYIGTAQALTPILAPTVGGWLHGAFGWHSVFLVLAGCGALFATLALTLIPETLPTRDALALNPTRLGRNVRTLLSDPVFMSYVAVVTCGFCGQFAFISSSAYVLITVIGVTPQVYGLCFGVVAFGLMTGGFSTSRLTRRYSINAIILGATAICATMGCLLAVLMLAGVHSVWAIILPMYGYAVGVGHVFPTASAGAIGPYPRTAGLASALLGFINLTGSAVYAVLVGALFDGTPRPMALAVAFAGVAALLVFVGLSRLRSSAAAGAGT